MRSNETKPAENVPQTQRSASGRATELRADDLANVSGGARWFWGPLPLPIISPDDPRFGL